MITYNIIRNNYEKSITFEKALIAELDQENFQVDVKNPKYVFVIGGDGTFLRATSLYNQILNDVIFVPFNSGGVGYYTNKNRMIDLANIKTRIINEVKKPIEYDLLEVVIDNKKTYVVNEIKMGNSSHPIEFVISINDVFLEKFKGEGVCASTATGSTGYMRSVGGSIILPKNQGIYEFIEIAPINSNRYRTLNSSIILTKNDVLSLETPSEFYVFQDTIKQKLKNKKIIIKIAEAKLKIISNFVTNNETKILRNVFVQDDLD
ncbi:hypothetical protein [Spiroplasma endosymbiont of Crioceris asparagi]|uniref:hypothetical protein n=1 Tax=Spiroplasma endosymbiont of Crioceris asparagi TaxID=3066286 RepID=UPI0030D4B963